jgi:hypothetical protein
LEDYRFYARTRASGFPLLVFIMKLNDLNHPFAPRFDSVKKRVGNFVREDEKAEFYGLVAEFKKHLEQNKKSII